MLCFLCTLVFLVRFEIKSDQNDAFVYGKGANSLYC